MNAFYLKRFFEKQSIRWSVGFFLIAALCLNASVYNVLNTQNDGDYSFRWALLQANSHPGPDTIQFIIPKSDAGYDGKVWTIKPLEELPIIDDSGTLIDGGNQTVIANSNPLGPEVFIDGRDTGTSKNGLTIISSNNTVVGLTISGFDGSGILIYSDNADENTIYACFIGTDPDGMSAVPNLVGINIGQGANANSVGIASMNFALKNVISGNSHYGIMIYGADGNVVNFNFIGTDCEGASDLGNGWAGIWISNGACNNTIGSGFPGANIISGNENEGVLISGGNTSDNLVCKNWIGTDVSGMSPIKNGTGIFIQDGAHSNNLSGNLISGNNYGIIIRDAGSDSNFVHGNWIGLDATGLVALPNSSHGLRIENGARYNFIGGITYSEKNVVSGNGWSGLSTVGDSTAFNTFSFNFSGTDTSGLKAVGNIYYGAHFSGKKNVFWGNVLSGNRCGVVISNYTEGSILNYNLIGLGADGETPVPNDEAGIQIKDNAINNQIGMNNKICFNHGFGVELIGSNVKYTKITRNSITANDSGGISLKDGANNGIIPPVIESAFAEGNLSGITLPSSLVELFADDGNQGKIYLSSVWSDNTGHWTAEGLTAEGMYFTATVTDGNGNSSAFSNPAAVTTLVKEISAVQPKTFSLFQNFPNPFNPMTTIAYTVPFREKIHIKVCSLRGEDIVTLVQEEKDPGLYKIIFDGSGLSSGIYYYRLETSHFLQTRKFIIIK